MKVILEIPDEEVEIINRNGFNKDGSFSFKLNEVVKQAIRNGVILPDNATNGDVIKAMFPNVNFGTLAQDDVIVNKDYSNNDEPQVFIPIRVWNAPYKSDCIPSEYDLSEDIELSNPQMYR